MSRERTSSLSPEATNSPLPFDSSSTSRTVTCSPRSTKMPAAFSVYGTVAPSVPVNSCW